MKPQTAPACEKRGEERNNEHKNKTKRRKLMKIQAFRKEMMLMMMMMMIQQMAFCGFSCFLHNSLFHTHFNLNHLKQKFFVVRGWGFPKQLFRVFIKTHFCCWFELKNEYFVLNLYQHSQNRETTVAKTQWKLWNWDFLSVNKARNNGKWGKIDLLKLIDDFF